jgi:Helicase associated domain
MQAAPRSHDGDDEAVAAALAAAETVAVESQIQHHPAAAPAPAPLENPGTLTYHNHGAAEEASAEFPPESASAAAASASAAADNNNNSNSNPDPDHASLVRDGLLCDEDTEAVLAEVEGTLRDHDNNSSNVSRKRKAEEDESLTTGRASRRHHGDDDDDTGGNHQEDNQHARYHGSQHHDLDPVGNVGNDEGFVDDGGSDNHHLHHHHSLLESNAAAAAASAAYVSAANTELDGGGGGDAIAAAAAAVAAAALTTSDPPSTSEGAPPTRRAAPRKSSSSASAPPRVSWEDRIEQLKQYRDEHGDLLIPIRYKKNPSLGKFVHNTREQFKLFHKRAPPNYKKKCSLTQERIEQLDQIGTPKSEGPRRQSLVASDPVSYCNDNPTVFLLLLLFCRLRLGDGAVQEAGRGLEREARAAPRVQGGAQGLPGPARLQGRPELRRVGAPAEDHVRDPPQGGAGQRNGRGTDEEARGDGVQLCTCVRFGLGAACDLNMTRDRLVCLREPRFSPVAFLLR